MILPLKNQRRNLTKPPMQSQQLVRRVRLLSKMRSLIETLSRASLDTLTMPEFHPETQVNSNQDYLKKIHQLRMLKEKLKVMVKQKEIQLVLLNLIMLDHQQT